MAIGISLARLFSECPGPSSSSFPWQVELFLLRARGRRPDFWIAFSWAVVRRSNLASSRCNRKGEFVGSIQDSPKRSMHHGELQIDRNQATFRERWFISCRGEFKLRRFGVSRLHRELSVGLGMILKLKLTDEKRMGQFSATSPASVLSRCSDCQD